MEYENRKNEDVRKGVRRKVGVRGRTKRLLGEEVGQTIDFGDFFFFQAEDSIRDVERSRRLGDVYKRQSILFNIRAVR